MNSEKTSSFLTEVSEQPEALENLIAFYEGEGMPLLEQWTRLARESGRIRFCGMGTSKFAPEMVLSTLGCHGLDASAMEAGELLHYPMPMRGLPVLISQSGESIETQKLAGQMENKDHLIAVTNNQQSALARAAKLILPMCAGHETAISTKTYVNTLALLFLMSESFRGVEAVHQALIRLRKLKDAMSGYDCEGIKQAASLLSDASVIHFISRGPAMAAVRQAALTFMEGAIISAAAFTGGAFRHGPFELVDETHRCVIFIPGGKTVALLKNMALDIAGKGSRVVVITDQNFTLSGSGCSVLHVPDFGEELFCLSAATTQAFLLDAVADRRGIQAGIFRYGEKITRRE
jgi:glucosamine--fructose-6-phosphate aminotransferase (isomerizing)